MLNVSINSFGYDPANPILKQLSFELAPGEHLAVLGESGSGKSTLLHLIYGLFDAYDGNISWNDTPILGPSKSLVPGAPFMKLVAQDANVMPFTTAMDNIREHLPRLDANADIARAQDLLDLVGLSGLANTMVKTLSGGQKQRIAIAKALAKEPELILLDEPFSHIDEHRKSTLRKRVYSYLKDSKISCITATHDAFEALSFADKILIIKDATLSFLGTPEALYNGIENSFHAGFFGEINTLRLDPKSKKEVFLFPHQLQVSPTKTKIQATVIGSYFKGTHYLIEAKWKDKTIYVNHVAAIPKDSRLFIKPNAI
ncbi:MAG: ABC transporter ATP-binding protein [Gilvibacter sp.]